MERLLDLFMRYRKVSTDTRTISKDCIYFALRGDRFDGNLFAAEAISKGAIIAVTDDSSREGTPGYLVVPDTLKALQDLACAYRKTLSIPIIGITGSNGKTTTKELTRSVLSMKYRVHATQGNLNNHIGVPLTLLSIPSDAEIGIVEMGANYPDEIAELASIALPDIGIITSIGKAHLEGFGSLETIARTKSGLFQEVIRQNGWLFYHSSELVHVKSFVGDWMKICVVEQSSFKVLNEYWTFELLSEVPMLAFSMSNEGNTYKGSSTLVGAYNFKNILLAIAVGRYFKIKMDDILVGVANYCPENNRTQRVSFSGHTIWLDAYNANPTSMLSAIQMMEKMPGHEPKVLILGGMREMGSESVAEHQALLNHVAGLGWYKVFLIGHEYNNLLFPENVSIEQSDINRVREWLEKEKQSCVVLIKGSRAYALEGIVKI